MVKIKIDDEVWNLYRKSWILCGVKDHYKQVQMLEDQLWAESSEIVEDLQSEFEAYAQREIDLKEEHGKRSIAK
jgi:hypothetical protein